MLGYIRTLDSSQTGLKCLCTPHPAFYDQEALTLHQVKPHDVRAFAGSKAFQSGSP